MRSDKPSKEQVTYEVGELDLATGEYVLLYHLDQIPLRCVSFLA